MLWTPKWWAGGLKARGEGAAATPQASRAVLAGHGPD